MQTTTTILNGDYSNHDEWRFSYKLLGTHRHRVRPNTTSSRCSYKRSGSPALDLRAFFAFTARLLLLCCLFFLSAAGSCALSFQNVPALNCTRGCQFSANTDCAALPPLASDSDLLDVEDPSLSVSSSAPKAQPAVTGAVRSAARVHPAHQQKA